MKREEIFAAVLMTIILGVGAYLVYVILVCDFAGCP